MSARYHFDYLDRNFECDFYQDHVLQRFDYLGSAALVIVAVIIFGCDKMPNKRSCHSNVCLQNDGNARGKDNGRDNRNSSDDNTSDTLTLTGKFLSRLVNSFIIFTVKRSLNPT